MITRYIKGDITETELKYIAHGVNCQNVMGSGVAKSLFTKWPEVKDSYHMFCESVLGYLNNVQLVACNQNTSDEVYVFNCFTQEFYGYDNKRYVNYAAIVKCFSYLVKELSRFDTPLAIPKIGCGLAGGDWNIVEQLINDTVGDDLEVWVYEL